MPCICQLHSIIIDNQKDRAVGRADKNDTVVPCHFEHGAEIPANGRLSPNIRERRFAAKSKAGRSRKVRASQGPGHDHERILRTKRFDTRVKTIEK